MKLIMLGCLEECFLLTYRTPAKTVKNLVPSPMNLLTWGEWAFWNIVVCRLQEMRPMGFPKWCSFRYHHVAYRLYVSAKGVNGEIVKGIHFLRSDVDHMMLAKFGNILTDFRFHNAEIKLSIETESASLSVKSHDGIGNADMSVDFNKQVVLSKESCFSSLDEAGRFLKYPPTGLTCDNRGKKLRLAEVFRDEAKWREKPIHVSKVRWAFLEQLHQQDAILELATHIAPLEYQWRLGRSISI